MLDIPSLPGFAPDNATARTSDLGSIDVLPIARQLTGIFLRHIPDKRIRDDLGSLITEKILTNKPSVNIDLYNDGLNIAKKYSSSAEDQAHLAGYLAKIGYLIDLAGHISDSNVINEFKTRTDHALARFNADSPEARLPELRENQVMRRTFADLLYRTERGRSIDEIIKVLGKPTQEDIFTMHPTGMVTLASTEMQRQIHDLSIAYARSPSEARWRTLEQTIERFATPDFYLTPITEDGVRTGRKRSLTVSEEVDFENLYMKRSRAAEEDVYHEADLALKQRYGRDYTVARKMELQFKRTDGGWTGTDVDGNINKNAAFMLEKIIKNNLETSTVYWKKFITVENEAAALPPEHAKQVRAVANKWGGVFAEAQASLRIQLSRLEDSKDANGNIILSPKDYDDISESAANAFTRHGSLAHMSKRLMSDLTDLLKPCVDKNIEPPAGLLSLHRRLRDSGLALAHSEIRENANVHQKVMEFLLADFDHPLLYGKKFHELVDKRGEPDQKKRAEFLNTLVQENHGTLEKLVTQALAKIRSANDLADSENPAVLTYNTLKRVENAHRHPGTVQNMLIAECKGVGDIMTAFTLQRMVSAYVDDGQQLRLHVCPLFEDPNMLKKMARISKSALGFGSYRSHVQKLGNTIKIMRAYSDNWRLTGTIASISGLLGSHYETMKSHGIDEERFTLNRRKGPNEQFTVQYHEGMGECDMHRGGGRDRGARMWQYASQEHSKGTIQGIADFLNLVNIPSCLSRTIESGFIYAANLILKDHTITPSPSENFVIAAGKASVAAFQKRHLSEEAQNFFASPFINAKISTAVRNASSRAAARGSDGDDTDDYIHQKPVDLARSRAISTSKLWSEADIVQTWAVADVWVKSMNKLWTKNVDGIQQHLAERANHLVESGKISFKNTKVSTNELYDRKNGLTSLAFQTLYHDTEAPTFRYITDVVAAGVRRSPLELLDYRMEIEKKAGLNDHQTDYPNHMRREFVAAAKLTVQIFAPDKLPADNTSFIPTAEACRNLRQIVIRDALPDLELAEKGRFVSITHALRDASIMAYHEAQKSETQPIESKWWLRAWRDIGAANDSVYYGRHGSSDTGVRTARRIIRQEQQQRLVG